MGQSIWLGALDKIVAVVCMDWVLTSIERLIVQYFMVLVGIGIYDWTFRLALYCLVYSVGVWLGRNLRIFKAVYKQGWNQDIPLCGWVGVERCSKIYVTRMTKKLGFSLNFIGNKYFSGKKFLLSNNQQRFIFQSDTFSVEKASVATIL